eukprot:COSAG01_NODE_592_length_15109_cov_39.247435_14_plen_70_part_00
MGSDGEAPERPQDETRAQKAQPRRKFHLLRRRHHYSTHPIGCTAAAKEQAPQNGVFVSTSKYSLENWLE